MWKERVRSTVSPDDLKAASLAIVMKLSTTPFHDFAGLDPRGAPMSGPLMAALVSFK